MSPLAGRPAGTDDDAVVSRALLEPYLSAGRWHAADLGSRAGLSWGPEFTEGLARHLVDRVGFAASGLVRESAPLPGWAGMSGRDFRRALLWEYPVLRRLLGTVWRGWSEFTASLAARLARDLPEVQVALLDDPSARPVWCVPGVGDTHLGSSVTVVGFTGGHRVVYRPRDSSHLVAWEAVLRLLAEAGPAVRLRAARVLSGDGYAWAEFVAGALPRTTAEREQLCRRLGMTSRLLEVLGASDMSESNLVVARDHLVVIDTETLIAPGVRPPAVPGTPAPPRAAPASWASVGTGLLSLPMTLDVRLGLRNFALPAHPDFQFLTSGAPLVLDGYAAMHRALVSVRARGAGAGAVLGPFEGARVRFLARGTPVYSAVMNAALAAESLRDEREFMAKLRRLDRAVAAAPGGARPALARLVDAEVAALADLDIPYFEIDATSTDVRLPGTGAEPGLGCLPGESVLPGYVSASPCARAAARLRALGSEVTPEELDTVRALLAAASPAGIVAAQPSQATGLTPAWSGRPNGGGLPTGGALPAGSGLPSGTDWGGRAAEVARVLADRALADDGALTLRPHNGVVTLERLRPDVLSGYAGIAVVLADTAALLGDPTLAGHARALADRVESSLRDALMAVGTPRPRELLDPGAYCGIGSLVYALARVEASLGPAGSRWRDDVADVLAGGGKVEAAAARHGWDLSIATGTAGLVLALAAAGLSRGLASWWPGFAARALDGMSPARSLHAASGSPAPHPLAAWCFPSEAASVQAVAARLGTTVDGAVGAAEGAAPGGKPGAVLAASRAREADRLLSRVADADAEAMATAASAVASAPGIRTSLAALTEVEVGLAAQGSAGQAGRLLAESAGQVLVTRHDATGAWFPEAVAPDRYRLSALWGLGAVCHAFTRLASPSPGPSLRLLEPCVPPAHDRHPPGSPPRP